MSHCKNCGHPSHCGVPLYSENHFNLKDEIQQGIKLCDSCSCEECCKHKCSKCKENKCTIVPRFNRSLDEGVNLTVTCMNCSFEWNA